MDKSKDWVMSDGLPLLGKLLEAPNERGYTALLIACLQKDCAIAELLLESGADAKALDQDGNTAILLAASSTAIAIPSKGNSPAIFKVFLIIYSFNRYFLLIFYSSTFSVIGKQWSH